MCVVTVYTRISPKAAAGNDVQNEIRVLKRLIHTCDPPRGQGRRPHPQSLLCEQLLQEAVWFCVSAVEHLGSDGGDFVASILFFPHVDITLVWFLGLGMSKVRSGLHWQQAWLLRVSWLQELVQSWVCAPSPFHSWGCAGWNMILPFWGTSLF